VFVHFSLGVLTKRDSLTVGFQVNDVTKLLSELADKRRSDSEIAQRFGVRLQDNDGISCSPATTFGRKRV
jgi:hypothetical protein